jgi:hypothetical protein
LGSFFPLRGISLDLDFCAQLAKGQIFAPTQKFALLPALKCCTREAQQCRVQSGILGSNSGISGRTFENLVFSCCKVSVRTLPLQPPPPGCSGSCAAHAIKLAGRPPAKVAAK